VNESAELIQELMIENGLNGTVHPVTVDFCLMGEVGCDEPSHRQGALIMPIDAPPHEKGAPTSS
jgi:hypothetical protein